MECVEKLGVKNDEAGLDYFISANDQVSISSLPIELHNGYIAIAIGAQHSTKRMPVHKLIELCKSITSKIVLLGGKEDVKMAEEIVKTDPEKIFSACGKYSLNQSASLIKQADMLISHDTGLMHIAAAFKKKIVSIWGNTMPELGMYPYKTEHFNAEVKGLSCRPCSKIGFNECPKKHFNCMELQDVNAIARKVEEYVK
jgi:ADP-heptose:LPS heptosyltransferase